MTHVQWGHMLVRNPKQEFAGVIALILPAVRISLLHVVQPSATIVLSAIIASYSATTILFFIAFDHRVSKFDFLPFLNVVWKSVLLAGVTTAFWVLVLAITLQKMSIAEEFFMVPGWAVLISLPTCGMWICIRVRINPPDADCYIRCRVCEYRVDNVSGPRCPECGMVVDGSY